MQSKETITDYHERINKVLIYIDNHLGEKLDLEALASVSNFSAFHFHRIMRAYLHESIGSYISRLRLETAASLLQFTDLSINEIAFKIGYETPSSFTKAFRKKFNISPSEFRNRNGNQKMHKDHRLFNLKYTEMKSKPQIKTMKPKKVAYIQAIGDYNDVGPTWEKLSAFFKENKLFGFKTEAIGISHNDPNITETEKLRYDACFTVTKDIQAQGEVGVKTIEGGRYAIFKHFGPYSQFQETYDEIYRRWLPESGYELRDLPPFELYRNDPGKTKPEKLLTEIYVPIQ